MTTEELKARTLEGFERMFNEGDLAYVDNALAPGAIDHQEPDGTDLAAHLKNVISTLRAAFPDLRFNVHEIICEGDVVACRSTMKRHPSRAAADRADGRPAGERHAHRGSPHALLPLRRRRPSHRPLARLEHAHARPATRRTRTRPEHQRARMKLATAEVLRTVLSSF